MFEGHAQASAGIMANVARVNGQTADDYRRMYRELGEMYDGLKERADRLERENAELRLSLAVEQAVVVADDAAAAAWRETHPTSPMRAAVGRRRDGSPLTRALSIWISAFDAAARQRGITNPEAHRIS